MNQDEKNIDEELLIRSYMKNSINPESKSETPYTIANIANKEKVIFEEKFQTKSKLTNKARVRNSTKSNIDAFLDDYAKSFEFNHDVKHKNKGISPKALGVLFYIKQLLEKNPEGKFTKGQIAKNIGVEKGNIPPLLTCLRRRKLITREEFSGGYKGFLRYTLTPEAHEVIENSKPKLLKFFLQMDALSKNKNEVIFV